MTSAQPSPQNAAAQEAILDAVPGALNAWLMLLGINLLCVRPIFDIAAGIPLLRLLNDLDPAMPLFKWPIVAVMAGACLLNVVAGLLLFARRKRSTVKIAYLALWLAGPVCGAVMFAIVLWAKNLPFSSLLDTSAPNAFLRSVVVATGWTLYLALSRSVKVRYGTGRSW